MSRPKKCRCLDYKPPASSFKPCGCKCAREIVVFADETEVLKLMDYDDMTQEETATKLGVSRVTVQRIYKSGRNKIAQAIVLGARINFEGGGEKNG